jgi:CRISPR system Cascade subunit CasB
MSTQVPEANLSQVIGRVAAAIDSDWLSTGDRAALRRMSPDQPPLAFYRFALRYLPEGWDSTEELRRDWTTLVAGMAIVSPNPHRPDLPFGQALAEEGYSEARLERLLSADGDTQRTLLLRAARFLAAKTAACNWIHPAQLLLTRHADRREQCRRRIAGDFYSALEKKQREVV